MAIAPEEKELLNEDCGADVAVAEPPGMAADESLWQEDTATAMDKPTVIPAGARFTGASTRSAYHRYQPLAGGYNSNSEPHKARVFRPCDACNCRPSPKKVRRYWQPARDGRRFFSTGRCSRQSNVMASGSCPMPVPPAAMPG